MAKMLDKKHKCKTSIKNVYGSFKSNYHTILAMTALQFSG